MKNCVRCKRNDNLTSREVELGITTFLFHSDAKQYTMQECEDRRDTETILICEDCYQVMLNSDWSIDLLLLEFIKSIKEIT